MLSIIFVSLIAFANNSALTCSGRSEPHNMKFDINMTGVKGNKVVFTSTLTNKQCKCTFRLTNFNDLSSGQIQKQVTRIAYESCSKECPDEMKKRISAGIAITYEKQTGESFTAPFVGNSLVKCSNFSIDSRSLRQFESERISQLDMPTEIKNKLSFLNNDK